MFRFILGVAVGCTGYHIFKYHPEMVLRTMVAARDQLSIAATNTATLLSNDPRGSRALPEASSPTIDYARARALAQPFHCLGQPGGSCSGTR